MFHFAFPSDGAGGEASWGAEGVGGLGLLLYHCCFIAGPDHGIHNWITFQGFLFVNEAHTGFFV